MNDLIVLERIAQWEKLKRLVLDSVSSPITKRVYNMALNEFMAWFSPTIPVISRRTSCQDSPLPVAPNTSFFNWPRVRVCFV